MSTFEQELKYKAVKREAIRRTSKTVFKLTLAFSILFGYADLYHRYPGPMSNVTLGLMALFFGVIVVYGIYTNHFEQIRHNGNENTRP